jgi:methionyl-tRNA synthetase
MVDALAKEIDTSLSEIDIGDAMSKMLSISTIGNKYFQDNKPWELINTDKDRCEKVLFVCANICRALCVLMKPYLPTASERLSQHLGMTVSSFDDAKTMPKGSISIGIPQPLFQKLEVGKPDASLPVSGKKR